MSFDFFGPVCEVIVAGNGQSGVKYNQEFDISFTVDRGRSSDPNQAVIEIYNLSAQTRRRFSKEFKRLILTAGYNDYSDVIFSGEIVKAEHSKSSDGFLTRIQAQDGAVAWSKSYVNAQATAGQSVESVIRQIVATMPNVTMGSIVGLSDATPMRRRYIMNGMSRDKLDEICRTYDARWSIQNGVVEVISNTKAASKQSAYVLNSGTGLLEVKPTERGVLVSALLNPSFKPNNLVSIESRYIDTENSESQKNDAVLGGGVYRINAVRFTGQTFGGSGFGAALDCQLYSEGVVESAPSVEQAVKTSSEGI